MGPPSRDSTPQAYATTLAHPPRTRAVSGEAFPSSGRRQRKTKEDTYRHVIGPLGVVPVQLLALGPRGGRDAVEGITHVGANVVVPVLVEAERAARVLDEQVQESDLVVLELRQLADDNVRHEVGAPRARG